MKQITDCIPNVRIATFLVFFVSQIATGLILTTHALYAQDAPPKPKLTIVQSSFDFGVVPQGALVTHDFLLKNEGNAELVIQKVVAACGCTAALPPNGAVAPGSQVAIPVSFDTAGFSGKTEKTVRVFSNDLENPTPVLTLKGTIDTQFTLQPNRIRFQDVTMGAFVEPQRFTIRIDPASSWNLDAIEAFSDSIQIKVIEKSQKNGVVEVSLGTTLRSGALRERVIVSLKDSSGKAQNISVPVVGTIKGPIEIQPRIVSLGVIQGTEPLTRSVKLNSLAKEPLTLSSVTADNNLIEVTVKEVKPGSSFVVSVTVDPKRVTTDLKSAVRIKTNYASQPEVVLDVYGIVPPKA